MGEWIGSQNTSVEALIEWLRAKRGNHPTTPLSELLPPHASKDERLVDLACIDLIERRRLGHEIRVESYLDEFPMLRGDAERLDLIDAEICVMQELRGSPDMESYVRRFPDLANAIRELVGLEGASLDRGVLVVPNPAEEQPAPPQTQRPPARTNPAPSVTGRKPALPDQTMESLAGSSIEESVVAPMPSAPLQSSAADAQTYQSVAPQSAAASPGSSSRSSKSTPSRSRAARMQSASIADSVPVELPDWFVGQKCVASSPGRWLIQGRDANRGQAMALKVIELPTHVTAERHNEILDACERAASVQNAAWTVPGVAAIQNRHLAVIRPWLFAHAWQQSPEPSSTAAELQRLATVAFAVQAAHDVGATHGGIHRDNLLVDHQGNAHVVDAICTFQGLARWLRCRENTGSSAVIRDRQRELDLQGLIKLVLSIAIEWGGNESRNLTREAEQVPREPEEKPAALLGELLMAYASENRSAGNQTYLRHDRRPRWPSTLMRWIFGGNR